MVKLLYLAMHISLPFQFQIHIVCMLFVNYILLIKYQWSEYFTKFEFSNEDAVVMEIRVLGLKSF